MTTVRAYAPGRTEIAGNHTDHQGGRVIAAAVSCGVEMTLRRSSLPRARVQSAGFEPFEMDLADDAPRQDERFTTASLVRGVVAGLRARGVPVSGFDVSAKSTVPAGGGLSSSAAFELALAVGLDELYGDGVLGDDPVALAVIGQAAESGYFGKPCGLMDQLAVACGGVNLFDFHAMGQGPSGDGRPEIERVDFDFARHGFALCLVDTHCDHSLYTDEYAQVARDMHAVAAFMGAAGLSRVPEQAYLDRLEEARAQLGDLPALRGLHYFREMKLVDDRAQAMRAGDMRAFLDATRKSGASSAMFLQNVSCLGRPEQPAMMALALCERYLEGEGAVRIHGGGFGGTVQAFVPIDRLGQFTRCVDSHLGAGSCQAYGIVPEGVRALRAPSE